MAETDRVLVVDDIESILNMTRRALEAANLTVLTARDGEEALEIVRKERPAVVLLDVSMPKMDGFEVCRRIKNDPALKSIYVAIVSASRIDLDSKVAGLEIGADDYLTRPIPNRELQARVRAMLRIYRAEQAVRQREQQLHDVIANNVDGMIVVDEEGRALFANPAACCLLNRPAEQIVGEMVGLPVTAPGDYTEVELWQGDGRQRTVEMRVSALQWEGRPAWLASLRDITERKQTERALRETLADLQRSNADLESFAYMVSHDLQEPLRMITGFLSLLRSRYEGQLDADANEFIAFAFDGAQRMQRLIRDLLTYARVGSRGGDMQPTAGETILEKALANLRTAIEETGATITHDPLPTVLGDEAQLIQLFQNLIANAIKFHGVEPPRVHITAEPGRPKHELEGPEYHTYHPLSSVRPPVEWRFAVRDNGIGIAPEHFERIFVIFQRLHSRQEYDGTGIGLAVCKKIVERHGGRIWVESAPGQGSTFYFTLPGVA